MDRGYVLHSYPYRETSLILQAWTEKHGRLGLVAKGARRPKSASRAVLVPFQPLALDWFGRGELRTLKTAEPTAAATPLAGEALMSAFYMNELLLKLTTRDDPHERLFAAYDLAITELRALSRSGPAPQAARLEPILRRFELDGRMRRIAATIYVDRPGHKAIVIGEKGATLKRIGTEARHAMEELFGSKVFLELWVKVKGGWADSDAALRQLGYK